MLAELLTQDPNNVLARYGLAMEYSNYRRLRPLAGRIPKAARRQS